MPKSDRYLVLDISEHQRNFDYFKFKANHPEVLAVILRVGFTGWGKAKNKLKDSMFDVHYSGFKRVGLPVGVYYYSCAVTVEEAKEEARLTQLYLKDKIIDFPVWWDTEDDHDINAAGASLTSQAMLSKNALTDIAIAYCDEMERAGYFVGIYASTSWFTNRLDLTRLRRYDKWVAHYGVAKPNVSFTYGMHQFTNRAMVEGYRGYVDMNWCTRDYPTIIKNAGLNGFKKPSEADTCDEQVDEAMMMLQIALETIKTAMDLLQGGHDGKK
jgi:GH25 family lysozyme M1 (1,4-beta-N-acetylmuramidase)